MPLESVNQKVIVNMINTSQSLYKKAILEDLDVSLKLNENT